VTLGELDVGAYCIYAGAMEAPRGAGYIAAVVVLRRGGPGKPREVYRNMSLDDGHRWSSSADALNYAITKGKQVIHNLIAPAGASTATSIK